MSTAKEDYTGGSAKRLAVEYGVGNRFKKHCDGLNLDMKEALDIILRFILDNNIHPDELSMIWEKKVTAELKAAKGEVSKIHNYTASFLKTFEKEQATRDENLKVIIKNLHQKNTFLSAVLEEVLFNSQLFVQLENEELGKRISQKNWDNIIEKEARSKR